MRDQSFTARQIRLRVGRLVAGADELGAGVGELGLRRDAGRELGDDHRMGAGKIGGQRFRSGGHQPIELHPPPAATRIVTRPRSDAKLPGDDASRSPTKDSRAGPPRSLPRRRLRSATKSGPVPASS